MIPRSVHHVFPYHANHFADSVKSWWDVQTSVWPVAAALASAHAPITTVHVISDHRIVRKGLRVHPATHAGPGKQRFGYDLSLSLLATLGKLGPGDVCFVHGAARPADILCAEAAISSRLITVYHGGGTGEDDRLKRLSSRHVVLRGEVADALFALGYGDGVVTELTPSVAAGFFEVRRNPKADVNVLVIGFIGRPGYSKGADSVAPALASLRAAGYRVVFELVGALDVDGSDSLRRDVLALGCDFHSWGFVPNGALPGIIAGWDALFFPSRSEGAPRSVLEAVAVGVPIVGVKGVVPDKFVDGRMIRVSSREMLPSALLEAVRMPTDVTAAAEPVGIARSHADGAADFDHIILGLADERHDRRRSVTSIGLALARMSRHSVTVRRLARPFVQPLRFLARR